MCLYVANWSKILMIFCSEHEPKLIIKKCARLNIERYRKIFKKDININIERYKYRKIFCKKIITVISNTSSYRVLLSYIINCINIKIWMSQYWIYTKTFTISFCNVLEISLLFTLSRKIQFTYKAKEARIYWF